jgi:PAS domain S-box-containing protein
VSDVHTKVSRHGSCFPAGQNSPCSESLGAAYPLVVSQPGSRCGSHATAGQPGAQDNSASSMDNGNGNGQACPRVACDFLSLESPEDFELKPPAANHPVCMLAEVNAKLAGSFDASQVLDQIVSRLCEMAGLSHASIYRLSPGENVLRCIASSGDPTPDQHGPLALGGPELVAKVARTAKPSYIQDVPRVLRYTPRHRFMGAAYAVPLCAGENVLGVLAVEASGEDALSPSTRRLVDQVAASATLALERNVLHQRLCASEELFRSFFEQGHTGMALCSLNGELTRVNAALASLLGYTAEELFGRRLADFEEANDRQDQPVPLSRIWEDMISGQTREVRYLDKSGNRVWCTQTLSLVRDAQGRPAYLLALIQDISAQKKAQEERARLQTQLFQAQKMEALGTLASGIAHDFNNLLSVILGFASIARLRLGPADPMLESVKMIEQSAERAADLTRQLLGLARQGKSEQAPVKVVDILGRVVKIITRTFDRRIQVQTRTGSGSAWVVADASQLEQAILNLCINARDAMPEGGTLTLESALVTLAPDDPLRAPNCPPGQYVRISVQDTGTGIEPEVLDHIFDPFFTTKESGKGCGLGLAMVYGMVTNCGGSIHVESAVGGGSTFTIHLPSAPPADQPERGKIPALEGGTGTVLVADDEPMVLAFAQAALKRLGYSVMTAEDGRKALEVFTQKGSEIDCVLLDLAMPECGGIEACRRMREINPEVRVIISSGYSTGKTAQEARESGAVGFIGKPYTLEALALALKKARQVQAWPR